MLMNLGTIDTPKSHEDDEYGISAVSQDEGL